MWKYDKEWIDGAAPAWAKEEALERGRPRIDGGAGRSCRLITACAKDHEGAMRHTCAWAAIAVAALPEAHGDSDEERSPWTG